MRVIPVPMLRDNYAWLIVDQDSNEAAIVDPAEADVALAIATREGVRLTTILNTHHHADHTGGNEGLLRALPDLSVVGYRPDANRIPGITTPVSANDVVRIGGLEGRVLAVPCHTSGHVAYLFGQSLFCGDTLFAGGCGRFFEGTAADMYHALYRVIGVLPDETLVCCGHEYTAANLRFATTVEPSNAALRAKVQEVEGLRERGLPTVPTTLGQERTYNPFLRVTSEVLRASVRAAEPHVDLEDPVAVLAAVRRLKDKF